MRLAVGERMPGTVPSPDQVSSAQLGSKSVPCRSTDLGKEP
jgi:hypothetical protein